MSTLAHRINWPACCHARSQAQASNPSRQNNLAQRYAQADEHERLYLWLQFREARQELDLIEAQCKPRPASLRRRVYSCLGIPWLG